MTKGHSASRPPGQPRATDHRPTRGAGTALRSPITIVTAIATRPSMNSAAHAGAARRTSDRTGRPPVQGRPSACHPSGDVVDDAGAELIQRVAVVLIQLMLVPAALGSVHHSLSGSVRGSDCRLESTGLSDGRCGGANFERLSMEKRRLERYEALVARLEPSDQANLVLRLLLVKMVGARGFEPPTPRSRTERRRHVFRKILVVLEVG